MTSAPKPVTTWAQVQAEQQRDRAAYLRATLERYGWACNATAAVIGVTPSTLRSLIETHGLGEAYAERARPRGRPRKVARE